MQRGVDIFVWQPVLTDHQAYTLEALAQLRNCALVVYVAAMQDDERAAQGWTQVRDNSAWVEIRVMPRRSTFIYMCRQLRLHRHATHIFGSPFDRPDMMTAMFVAALTGISMYLVSEPYSPTSAGYFSDKVNLLGILRNALRPALYKLYGLILRRRVRGVFAISPLAVAQYRRLGVPPTRIFPFGYFVPFQTSPLKSTQSGARASGGAVRLVCVASLIRRKGVTELIAAVKNLCSRGMAIQADVFGPGDDSRFAFDGSHVTYRGVIPFGRAQEIIACYDLLVLASKYDGWGVVINEALMAGVPVVCSDRVGAAGVVRKWACGIVYGSSDPKGLEGALSNFANSVTDVQQLRRHASEAAVVLQPAVAAKYMLEALLSVERGAAPPECPWYATA